MLEPKWLRRGGLGAGKVLHCVLSTVTNLNIQCSKFYRVPWGPCFNVYGPAAQPRGLGASRPGARPQKGSPEPRAATQPCIEKPRV
jgi:hypothetical protein